MTKTEELILEIVKENGGSVPQEFIAETMQHMVKQGLLEAHFPYANKAIQTKFEYRLGKGKKK
ncbi:hypothetical protein [Lysinibacillus sp. 54212]|uniref:hypothetical protein n=1 Tax=Lysinibacillus sp. 54212 TaxID=3119829 RepID=UPI002FC8D915